MILLALTLTVVVRAQVEDKKRLHMPDSTKSDFEEWLRNEPLKPELHDSTATSPIEPSTMKLDPSKIQPKHPPISINIMTPELRNDMRLAYHSHWLDEQRKAQIGGAMTIGVSPLNLIALVVHKLFPKHKSKKQRERERLQEILDNY
jgi:hypothetical protein